MKRAAATNFGLVALATIGGAAWAMVYPYPNDWGLVLWVVLALAFAAAFFMGGPGLRHIAIRVSLVSLAAWLLVGLSLRFDVRYPASMPRVIHRIFGTDGEASYNASDAEFFILVFAALMVLLAVATWVVRTKNAKRMRSHGA